MAMSGVVVIGPDNKNDYIAVFPFPLIIRSCLLL